MVRQNDKFWEYVEDLNGRLLCKFCEQSFAGDIIRIKSHLSGVRGLDIEICPKVPETVQFAALEAIGAPNKKATSLTSLNNIDGETEIISTSAPNKKAKTLHQPAAIPGVCYKDKNAVDKLLSKFIISNNLPLDVSKAPFLVDLLKSIAEFGPTYELPNYLALKSQSIPDVTKEIEEYIGNVKRFFSRTSGTLLMSKVMKNSELVCINFFAYSPGGLVYIDKITIPEEGIPFQLFINGIYRIIKSLGPEHIFQCIIDDSEDRMVERFIDFEDDDFFSSVMKMILRKYPRIYLSRCASGEVGVLLVLTYLGVPWIHKTTQMAKLISKYLYRHDVDLIPRRRHTRNKQFDRSGLTKIAIEFSVLCSILEVEKELKALQLPIASSSSEREASSCTCDNVVAEVDVVYRAIHSTEFWSNGKKVVQVLQPLFQVLELVDCNGSTFGYLYEAMKKVEEAFKQHCEGDEGISKVFKGWRSRITNPMHAAAAFLNPAYMCSQNFTEDTEIQKGLKLLTILVPIEEHEALLKQMQLYRMKVSDLFTATAMEMLNALHPRKWWECFGDHYPVLQKYAILVLSQTCSTSLCHPCTFQPESLADASSINLIMMERFSLTKSQINLELIALDRISGLPEFADDYVKGRLQSLDWPDDVDYHDLLAPNSSNEQIMTPSESDDSDDSL